VVGTFLFGLISYITGNQRLSALTIGVFFLAGYWLLQGVDDSMQEQTLSTQKA
jgi:MFS-type transporter involved in bile tolerance (Atg22 family)